MTADQDVKSAQRTAWDAVSGGWERWDVFQEEQTRAVNEWLCRSAMLSPGKRVLDLASGSGQPALTAAEMVRPGGSVVATDISPQMLEVVRRRASADGLDNVETQVMDIEHLQFPDGSFDAVTCRWGYMFCPDLAKAFSESRRVLKPDGRLTFAVWGPPAGNPWLGTFVSGLNEISPPPAPPDPDALGPFRLSDRARIEGLLRETGWSDWALDPIDFHFKFDSAEQWWDFVFDIAAPIRDRILALSGSDQTAVRHFVAAQFSRFGSGASVAIPALNLCGVAVR
jgi:ubiquinone/menaquinone biosynthesis C-methylase UbiE